MYIRTNRLLVLLFFNTRERSFMGTRLGSRLRRLICLPFAKASRQTQWNWSNRDLPTSSCSSTMFSSLAKISSLIVTSSWTVTFPSNNSIFPDTANSRKDTPILNAQNDTQIIPFWVTEIKYSLLYLKIRDKPIQYKLPSHQKVQQSVSS